MRKELTFEELDSQQAELLPARETLSHGGSWGGSSNFANIYANNSSLALNAGSYCSQAHSAAYQSVVNLQNN